MADTRIHDKIFELFFTVSREIREKMMGFDSTTMQLTILQLQTLVLIKRHKTLTMSDVANEFKISLPTATVLTDKLIKMGLIERKEGKNDRRKVNVFLVRKGDRLMRKAMKVRHQKMNKILEYLMPEDKKALLRILTNLANNIQKSNEK
jgi:MarR family transcriptional regulator, transcriptional regulator for hemolysin